MASTYLNDLRIEEQATGENSGSWGNKVNSAFSQIAEAFSYGTKQLAADSNETFTMPDGTSDGTRSLYLKITSAGSLTATRTVTLGPNTVSKLWIIENATTGSQSITIAQGSGGTVTIPTGAVKMVYSDGAGSGAAVVDALVDLHLSGSTNLASLNVDGTVTADGLTVDTTTLVVDATNNRVGIGTASPGGQVESAHTDTSTYNQSTIKNDFIISRKNSSNVANQSVGLQFDITGWSGSTTGVAGITAIQPSNASSADLVFSLRKDGTYSERVRLDSRGVLGVNAVPEAWDSAFSSVMQVGAVSVLTSGGDNGRLFSNAYYDGGATYKRINTGYAHSYEQTGGTHRWYIGSGGSAAADSTFTWDEAARIDANRNLLVGTTNINPSQNAVEGIALSTGSYGGYFSAARSGGTVAQLARLTNDGPILDFRNASASVGSIGTEGGDLTIGNADTGLQFVNTSQIIRPQNLTTNTAIDAQVDLGQSAYRFKDLYLSGGVYLGGTGAANHLDDYEEGTWTPYIVGTTTAGGYSSVVQTGSYTKVGKVVTASFTFYGTSGTGSGSLNVTGFPYAAESSGSGPAVTILQYNSGLSLPSGTYVPILFIKPSTTTAEIRCTNSSSGSSFSLMSYPTTADYVRATITYLTS